MLSPEDFNRLGQDGGCGFLGRAAVRQPCLASPAVVGPNHTNDVISADCFGGFQQTVGRSSATWLILPDTSWNHRWRSRVSGSRIGLGFGKEELVATAWGFGEDAVDVFVFTASDHMTMESNGICPPIERMNAPALGLWAPSPMMRARVNQFHASRKSVWANFSSMPCSSPLNSPQRSSSTTAMTKPVLMAWCSPGAGAGMCMY